MQKTPDSSKDIVRSSKRPATGTLSSYALKFGQITGGRNRKVLEGPMGYRMDGLVNGVSKQGISAIKDVLKDEGYKI